MEVELPPFQIFLDAHREDVYRFLVASVGREDADDCFQETFLAALRAYPRIEDNSNLRSWILTIAHRKAIDAHRSRKRRPMPVETVPEPNRSASEPHASRDTSLWQAVRELPGKQRAAVVHRFVNDLAYVDIGQMTGSSEEAARRNVHEGLKKLRGAWQT
jgi:RNA polymerase sigma factor (sigma-70 family)